ncbi:T9SS C-terminal target domain-containing protein [Chryseobacterium carnipullorum]|uniref:Hemagglutinin A n=1 Tax=Chryseobacterium carnipullorum TaxID=1124835 RepID=A0A376DN55_CHRCU|nr:choice-of-anchor J domain-containing protein [Chryseobacterium carnipullorum]AZA48296.1 T9SS C-terminal target domain-containing protein [Chryseobacterium carnipullorum]AZA67596.1 T9SS C-terminal target domain-containing protein [Chryseobacterium carnipullorum]STC91760.1 Hemagglutinin A precursor [Chryseobacterium carnipullorum]
MKTKLLTMLFALPFMANAQFFQNFDAGTTTPAGWSVINGGDTNGFTFGPGAPRSVYSLPNAAQINFSTAAHDDFLVTPAITVVAGVNDRLTYFVKNQDPNYVESYAVKLSTTTATAAAFTTILTPLTPAPSKWTFFSVDLSSYVGQTVYVGFHSTSADMFRLLFDDVSSDTAPTVVPNCVAALTSPSNGATGVNPNSVTLTWTAPTSGPKVDSYDLYLDTNPNPTTLVASNYLFADFTTLLGNTTYYWKVVAKNAAGAAVGCQTSSFTTGESFAPYCYGNLLFTSGIEPITSVQLRSMTNTSSEALTSPGHENFANRNVSVEQGGTYPITFKGNTDGNNSNRFIVYIDWNQDGDFLDTGEVFFGTAATAVTLVNSTGIDTKTATGNIVVPATATLGKTRMRVKKTYGSTIYLSPCYSSGTTLTATSGTTAYGQAEDYSITIVPAGSLAVNETNAKTKLAVYPNPMQDILNISAADRKVTEVTFYSAEGRLVKSVKENVSVIQTNDLKSGVYVVKVKTADSEQTFKVIKE